MKMNRIRSAYDEKRRELAAVEYRMKVCSIELALLHQIRREFFPPVLSEIMALRKRGMTLSEIGKHFGVSKQRIHQVLRS